MKRSYYNPWQPVIDYLQRIDAIFQLTPELNQKVKDNYNNQSPIKRDTSKEITYDLGFDALDQE